jgi:hypothetical protein
MGKIRKNRRRAEIRQRNIGPINKLARRSRSPKKIFTVNAYTCSKLGELDTDNSDSYCVNWDNRTIAISDGASRSYDPRTWAEALTRNFTQNYPPLTAESIEKIASSQNIVTPDTLSWNEEELMINGSHATLLTVGSMQKRKKTITFAVHSIGDSILIICDKNGHISNAYPHVATDNFPIRPALTSNKAPYFRGKPEERASLKINAGETMYLMTDALARFVARNKTAQIDLLFPFLKKQDQKLFFEWALEKRNSSDIEDDDLTLVEVKF